LRERKRERGEKDRVIEKESGKEGEKGISVSNCL